MGPHFDTYERKCLPQAIWPNTAFRYFAFAAPNSVHVHLRNHHKNGGDSDNPPLLEGSIVIAISGLCTLEDTRSRASIVAYVGPTSSHSKNRIIEGTAFSQLYVDLHAAILGLRIAQAIHGSGVVIHDPRVEGYSRRELRRVIIQLDMPAIYEGIADYVPEWKRSGWNPNFNILHVNLWQELDGIIDELSTDDVHVSFWLVPQATNMQANEMAWRALIDDRAQRQTNLQYPVRAGFVIPLNPEASRNGRAPYPIFGHMIGQPSHANVAAASRALQAAVEQHPTALADLNRSRGTTVGGNVPASQAPQRHAAFPEHAPPLTGLPVPTLPRAGVERAPLGQPFTPSGSISGLVGLGEPIAIGEPAGVRNEGGAARARNVREDDERAGKKNDRGKRKDTGRKKSDAAKKDATTEKRNDTAQVGARSMDTEDIATVGTEGEQQAAQDMQDVRREA